MELAVLQKQLVTRFELLFEEVYEFLHPQLEVEMNCDFFESFVERIAPMQCFCIVFSFGGGAHEV